MGVTWLARAWVVAFFVSMLVSAVSEAAPERRVALVVGNASYRHTPPLKNAANDAKLMAQTLGGLGFRMVGGGPVIDADRPAMEKAIRAFG
ncbi:MAG: caspase family protein, partial [Magnetospirillum sp.]